jgi:antitoxin component YwqK of YwqJK toxin-antitoxin module
MTSLITGIVPPAGGILAGVATAPEPVPETARHTDGTVKFTGFYLDGALHGVWYRTDGSVMRTGGFARGRQVGVWRTFDRSGQVVKETAFTMAPQGG